MAEDTSGQSRLKQIFAKAKTLKDVHLTEMRDAFLYTLPARQAFWHQPGTQADRTRIYDSTATDSVMNLVTLTMRLLIPQNDRWAGVELRDAIKRARFANQPVPFELTQALDGFNRSLFEIIAESNFYLAADEAVTDCVIVGTGCLAIYPGDVASRPIEFRAIHPNQLYFVESASGTPDIVFREHEMSTRQLVQRWGIDALPVEIARELDTNPEARHKVTEVEEPLDPTESAKYRYSCHLCDAEWYELEAQESRFRTFIVFRWSKAAAEVWGESQVRHALPAIRSLNRLAQLIESFGEYAALGAWMNTDTASDMSKLSGKLVPGSIINVEEALQPLPFPGKFDISAAMLNDLRVQIKALLFDSPLPSTAQNNYLTATEVNARMSEFYRRVGQPALRLERELLEPVVRNLVERLVSYGFLPRPTPGFLSTLGLPEGIPLDQVFAVTVTSAIKRVLQINEATQDVQAFASVAQALGPSVVYKHVDVDALARKLLGDFGMSTDCMRSPAEVAELETQQQQLQAAQIAISGANQLVDLQTKIRGNQTNGLNPASAGSPLNAAAPVNTTATA